MDKEFCDCSDSFKPGLDKVINLSLASLTLAKWYKQLYQYPSTTPTNAPPPTTIALSFHYRDPTVGGLPASVCGGVSGEGARASIPRLLTGRARVFGMLQA